MPYMVTFTINIPQMYPNVSINLINLPYMDPSWVFTFKNGDFPIRKEVRTPSGRSSSLAHDLLLPETEQLNAQVLRNVENA